MKLRKLLNEIISENKLDFQDYESAMEYINGQVKLKGKTYYTSDEYKQLYPSVRKLWDLEHDKVKNKKQKELDSEDIKPGDKIEISWGTMFGGSDSIVGTLFMKSGIPYVKLPHKMSIGVKGKVVNKQSIPYSSKNMKKIG